MGTSSKAAAQQWLQRQQQHRNGCSVNSSTAINCTQTCVRAICKQPGGVQGSVEGTGQVGKALGKLANTQMSTSKAERQQVLLCFKVYLVLYLSYLL